MKSQWFLSICVLAIYYQEASADINYGNPAKDSTAKKTGEERGRKTPEENYQYLYHVSAKIDKNAPEKSVLRREGNTFFFEISTKEGNVEPLVPKLLGELLHQTVKDSLKNFPKSEKESSSFQKLGSILTFEDIFEPKGSNIETYRAKFRDTVLNSIDRTLSVVNEALAITTESLNNLTPEEISGLYSGQFLPSYFDKFRDAVKNVVKTKLDLQKKFLDIIDRQEKGARNAQRIILGMLPQIITPKPPVKLDQNPSSLFGVKFNIVANISTPLSYTLTEDKTYINVGITTPDGKIHFVLSAILGRIVSRSVKISLGNNRMSEYFVTFFREFGELLYYNEIFQPLSANLTDVQGKFDRAAIKGFGASPFGNESMAIRTEMFKKIKLEEMAALYNGRYMKSFFDKSNDAIRAALPQPAAGKPNLRKEFLESFKLLEKGVSNAQPLIKQVLLKLSSWIPVKPEDIEVKVSFTINEKLNLTYQITPTYNFLNVYLTSKKGDFRPAVPVILANIVSALVQNRVGEKVSFAPVLKNLCNKLSYQELTDPGSPSKASLIEKFKKAAQEANANAKLKYEKELAEIRKILFKDVTVDEIVGIFNGKFLPSFIDKSIAATKTVVKDDTVRGDILELFEKLRQGLLNSQIVISKLLPPIKKVVNYGINKINKSP